MPKKRFEDYTFEDAAEVFTEQNSKLGKTAENRKYIEGDDWQEGKGWVGPQFEGNNKVAQILKKEVERDFSAKGDLRSAVRRHVRGVIGRVPGWMISPRDSNGDPEAEPTTEETALIDEAQQILNEFWKWSKVHPTLKKAVEDLVTQTHAVLRLFFVQSETGELEIAKDIPSAVKKIYLFREDPASGCVRCNKKTLEFASFYRSESDGMINIEICFVNAEGKTVFRKLSKHSATDFAKQNFGNSISKYMDEKKPQQSEDIILPLDGKLLVFELSGQSLITPAMRSQQKIVNKAFTMLSHNLDMDGFRTKKILNGLPPGKFEKIDGKEVYVPDPNGEKVGAGSITYTTGLPVIERDQEGRIKQGYTTPSVHESQPIDVKSFIDSADAASAAILEDADQKHIMITGDAATSGESRREAREAFKQSLEDTKSNLDDVGSNIFEAVLAVVAYLMGQPDRYKDLQVTFNSILNPGPVSVEDRRVAREEAKDRFRSNESAMEEIGIIDPDAMKTKIKQEDEELTESNIKPELQNNLKE